MGLIVGPGIYIGGASKNHISTEEYAGSQSPYTFVASKGKLKSLIRYGKCEQSGTPSTASPVSIKCNNGTLTTKDAELPYGYRRLESIEFEGNTYYDTNEKLYGSDIVTMTISDFVSGGQNLFGAYAGNSEGTNNFSLYIYGTSTGQAYWRYGQTLYRPTLGGTTERTISFGAGGTDGFKTNVSHSTVEFESDSVAWIGGLPNSSSPKYDGKIVGNVTVGTRLKYIPCVRSSDGAIGYYETVNGVFLEPQGSSPVAGEYDDAHLVPYVDGTAEVVTLSAAGVADQTVSVESLFAIGNVKDEQDIISGTVTRRCGVCVYDGTQQVGDTFISMTGEKTVGTIIVYLLDEPVVEQVTPQPLTTQEGYNTLTVSSSVTSPEYKITYPDDLTKGHFEAEAEYVFQKSGGSNAISDGTAKFLSIKGKSLVWNQLMSPIDSVHAVSQQAGCSIDNGKIRIQGNSSRYYWIVVLKPEYRINVYAGHKYYCSVVYDSIENPFDYGLGTTIRDSQNHNIISTGNQLNTGRKSFIGISSYDDYVSQILFSVGFQHTPDSSLIYNLSRLVFIDLTLVFGAGNEPSTVEEFESLFPLPYYEYNAGEIISNKTEQVKVVGFNQWDEQWEVGTYQNNNGEKYDYVSNRIRSKNPIKIFPNTTYYCFYGGDRGSDHLYVYYYDAGGNYIASGSAGRISGNTFTSPSNARYMNFATYGGTTTTYNNDICINLSDPARNGQYEPYKKETIELNLPTLTGKLNGEGESVVVFPDGLKSAGNAYDEIVGNRAIKRVGVVDLGDLTYARNDVGDNVYMFKSDISGMKPAGTTAERLEGLICSKYIVDSVAVVNSTTHNKTIRKISSLYIRDDSYTAAATFKTAMSGVLLYYELAEPQVYILDTPLPKKYKVWSGGTEERLPRDTSSSVNAPVRYDVLYPEPED